MIHRMIHRMIYRMIQSQMPNLGLVKEQAEQAEQPSLADPAKLIQTISTH